MKSVKIEKNAVLTSTLNDSHKLTKFGKEVAFLEINQKTSFGPDIYLMIKKTEGSEYYVKGSVAANFSGLMSEARVLKGLKELGFEMTSKQFKQWIVA